MTYSNFLVIEVSDACFWAGLASSNVLLYLIQLVSNLDTYLINLLWWWYSSKFIGDDGLAPFGQIHWPDLPNLGMSHGRVRSYFYLVPVKLLAHLRTLSVQNERKCPSFTIHVRSSFRTECRDIYREVNISQAVSFDCPRKSLTPSHANQNDFRALKALSL